MYRKLVVLCVLLVGMISLAACSVTEEAPKWQTARFYLLSDMYVYSEYEKEDLEWIEATSDESANLFHFRVRDSHTYFLVDLGYSVVEIFKSNANGEKGERIAYISITYVTGDMLSISHR